jgi:hypothetical protein
VQALSAGFHKCQRPNYCQCEIATAPPATAADNSNIKIVGQKGFATTQLFKAKTLNFESLGIGGLDKQFDAIFRRAFASRVFPPSIVQRLGIQHVKVWCCVLGIGLVTALPARKLDTVCYASG